MAKLKLQPDPTFTAPVKLSVPGEKDQVEARFIFKYRNKAEAQAFMDRMKNPPEGTTDADLCADALAGWVDKDFDAEYSREALETLLTNYANAALEILTAYMLELAGSKEKNSRR